MTTKSLNILFLAPEMTPYAKTGGLADVVGSLPCALKKLGVDVSVALPYYRTVAEQNFPIQSEMTGLEVPLGDVTLKCNVLKMIRDDGIPVYFFQREDLFDRPNLYGNSEGDYYDNLERFAYLCQASLCFAKKAGYRYDIIHCHDWQTGLVPVYLKTLYRADPFYMDTGTIFTIHNIGYQGLFPETKLGTCGLSYAEYHMDGLEYWGNMSLLKAGIVYSDAITTVSPKYSTEIQKPELGLGMEGVLKRRPEDLYGILNGADYAVWNPSIDKHIKIHYSPDNMEGKKKVKAALISEMNLGYQLLERPLCAMISRLTIQKGYDLLVKVIEDLVNLDAGIVILGTGEEKYQEELRNLERKYHKNMAIKIGFDESLAHRIMAGSDILLVPSRYEPCGLTQMYAMKYGTVPIVHATGGLDDTIHQFNPETGEGTGFKFRDYQPDDFIDQIKNALKIYTDKTVWDKIIQNGMNANFSWEESAQKYITLYKKISEKKSGIS